MGHSLLGFGFTVDAREDFAEAFEGKASDHSKFYTFVYTGHTVLDFTRHLIVQRPDGRNAVE